MSTYQSSFNSNKITLLSNVVKPFETRLKYYYKQLTQYINPIIVKSKFITILSTGSTDRAKNTLLRNIKDSKEIVAVLADNYIDTNFNHAKVYNYYCKLLNELKSINEFKEAIPEYYHQYISYIELKGNKKLIDLKDQSIFELMEEIILGNLLLGITNES